MEFNPENEGFRDISRLRLLLSMSGVSLMLVLFMVLMTIKGNFSFLWFAVTLACCAGTVCAAVGYRARNTWIAFLGAASLLSIVLAGIVASR